MTRTPPCRGGCARGPLESLGSDRARCPTCRTIYDYDKSMGLSTDRPGAKVQPR